MSHSPPCPGAPRPGCRPAASLRRRRASERPELGDVRGQAQIPGDLTVLLERRQRAREPAPDPRRALLPPRERRGLACATSTRAPRRGNESRASSGKKVQRARARSRAIRPVPARGLDYSRPDPPLGLHEQRGARDVDAQGRCPAPPLPGQASGHGGDVPLSACSCPATHATNRARRDRRGPRRRSPMRVASRPTPWIIDERQGVQKVQAHEVEPRHLTGATPLV